MDVYGSMVGAVEPVVSTKNGVQTFSKDASTALLQFLGSRYPQITSSWSLATGAATPSLSKEADADLWSFVTVSTSPGVGASTVYEQLQTLAPGAVVLADVQSATDVIQGKATQLVYAIAKSSAIASMVAASGASLAVVDTSVPAMQTPSGTTPETKKKFSIITPLIGAGIGLLVGGPGGAAVGAGIGVGIEVLRAA